ncbi:MAG: tetraacyldisaccharide 4'-kinase [Bacteroides sp.]|nr:tetraacyldisaccharide 4'-kinase [Bacteroides sp.]
MEDSTIRIYHGLRPIAWLYGLAVRLRNKLFDWGLLRSRSFSVPVICVGNLAVGGTGKTPHTEYLIALLQRHGLQVATLSRGYKRHSKGYLLADEASDARLIGDEPFQMKQKFPNIQVAVDEKRCHGIEELLKADSPRVDAILLDDAFQHRYVKAGLNILLTDYHRLYCDDLLLPAGRLREPACGKERAQIVIVTKCPHDLRPTDYDAISHRLQLQPHQQLYFTTFRYGRLYPLYPSRTSNLPVSLEGKQVVLLTGIASPAPLIQEVERQAESVTLLTFGDHHDFSEKDLHEMGRLFATLEEGKRLIVTTEKDAARLRGMVRADDSLAPYIRVLPIEIAFLQEKEELFNQNIMGYVRTDSRNRSLPEE